MLNLIILGTHFLVFVIALTCLRKGQGMASRILVVVSGIVGVPIFGLLTLAMLDFGNHAGNGTTGAWYLIFSVVTLGGVPIVTHLSAAVSGICASRLLRLFRNRNAAVSFNAAEFR